MRVYTAIKEDVDELISKLEKRIDEVPEAMTPEKEKPTQTEGT